MDPAARHVGARMLSEVQEETLEELLSSPRSTLTSEASSPPQPITELRSLITRYQKSTQSAPPPSLSVTGRYLPLIYHLISTLIAKPHEYALVVIDCEGRFDATRLVQILPSLAGPLFPIAHPATRLDLKHVYIFRPPRSQTAVKDAISAAEDYMLYGAHRSRSRQWWGTIVLGNTGGDVNAGWKGWLRVDKEAVGSFRFGMSVEEALLERKMRQSIVDAAGWIGTCRWGGYVWVAD